MNSAIYRSESFLSADEILAEFSLRFSFGIRFSISYSMIRLYSVLFLFIVSLQGQTLTFQNGDILSGNPMKISDGKLHWEATNLNTQVELPLAGLKEISYPKQIQSDSEKTSLMQVMMHRGDRYSGVITAISDTDVAINTAWAGEMTVARKFISQIRPLAQNENLLSNLSELQGWAPVPNRSRWNAAEEGITCQGRAAMNKEIITPESFRFSCKIKFLSTPRLKFFFHASEGNVYEPSEYLEFSLQRASVSARTKVSGNLEALGQNISVPELTPSNSHQLDLYCNFADQKMLFYLNGKQVKQWVLPKGLKANPWMYIFADYDGEVLLENAVLEKWNGVLPYDPEAISHLVSKDEKMMIYLVNGDAVDAQKISYKKNGILAKTNLGEIQVPLHRVGFVDFSGLPYQEAKRERNDVLLTLQNGNKITLSLESWQGGKLQGTSQNFEAIKVDETALKEVAFDIYQ